MSSTTVKGNESISLNIFRELMPYRIREILLVSSPYEAFVMEEDGPLLETIDIQYQDAQLSLPTPNITRVSTAQEALQMLHRQRFDMIITMPRLIDMNAFSLGREVKKNFPELPVFLLTQNANDVVNFEQNVSGDDVDRVFVWSGNPDVLLAMIKFREDRKNVAHDIRKAHVRVIIFVEDSPLYKSSLLPILYKAIFAQSAIVFDEGLNEKQRLLKLRARPKILVAENYEEAEKLYKRYKNHLMAVFSDTKFPKDGKKDSEAGIKLLSMIREEHPDMPLLLLSTDHKNAEKAEQIPAHFLGKHTLSLNNEILHFFGQNLGFGDFIFRLPDGREVARASNLRALEQILPAIPVESLTYHFQNNHFSSWLMARSQVELSFKLRAVKFEDTMDVNEMRTWLMGELRILRRKRFEGMVVQLNKDDYDEDIPFMKVGKGSMGGKARGLAFLSKLLFNEQSHLTKFEGIKIGLPQTIVLSTIWYDEFIKQNDLGRFPRMEYSNDEVIQRFLVAELPERLVDYLKLLLESIKDPIAVRSSSLLEDSHFEPFAGLYSTYMLPNCHYMMTERLKHLVKAIKLVYASVFFEAPRTFTKGTVHRTEEEKMAVIIQRIAGRRYKSHFYPWISGVAQSYNYYPIGNMKAEEGIAHIALGLGKTVVEGGQVVRFSPKSPGVIPNFNSVDDILEHSQRNFYALKLQDNLGDFRAESSTLARRDVADALKEEPISYLSSTYVPQDHCIRDTSSVPGPKVITFANVLKFEMFPLGEILSHFLELGTKEFGCPVEIEFSLNLQEGEMPPEFYLLQIRPMTTRNQFQEILISESDFQSAVCLSNMALGNGENDNIQDVIYVKPDAFDVAQTIKIAEQIRQMNRDMEENKYLLVGPGRWGSSDRWLGIPVAWEYISNAGAIIETALENFRPDPSQGSHMFHNLVSLGISYLTVSHSPDDVLDYGWLDAQEAVRETEFLKHVRFEKPFHLKVDGRTNKAVILP